jgi:CHAT domain-containing protein
MRLAPSVLTVIVAIATVAAGPQTAPPADIRPLEPGRPIERDLGGGGVHAYRVTVAAGQFCHILVEQRGIDVVVSIYTPDGTRMVEIDSPNDVTGPESIALVADAPGEYRVDVRALEMTARAGRYAVSIQDLRPATARDRVRIAAQRAFTDAKALRNQGTEESRRQAAGRYEEAVSLWQSAGDRRMEAYSLLEMGLIYGDLGEYQKALDAYVRARPAYADIGDGPGQRSVLTNTAWIYGQLGEDQKAIDAYTQVLQEGRALGDRASEALLLNNIAAAYAKLGDYAKALEMHLQVLPLRRAAQNLQGEAITLNNIGNCYQQLGQNDTALDYYRQALALVRPAEQGSAATSLRAASNDFYRATVLNNIGSVYRALGDQPRAVAAFDEALVLRRRIGDRNGEAATLFQIARLDRDRGNPAEALDRITRAIDTVENLRNGVGSQQMRASYFAAARQYHEFAIDVLMRLHEQRPSAGFDARALQMSERARARSLLELIAEAGAAIREGVDLPLLERERTVRRSISEAADRQTRLLRAVHTDEQAAAAARELDALVNDYEEVQAAIRRTSPRYAALTQPVPLDLQRIQADVLDAETLLLEYTLGDERSYVWAVTPAAIRSFALPRRAEIEAAGRRLYELLTARNHVVPNETPDERRRRVERADTDARRASAALSHILLGPVAAQLSAKRLAIVGEGILQYLPFAALPAPAGANAEPPAAGTPLIAAHEVVMLPSASALAVLRRETVGRPRAPKDVAVLADPVFGPLDPRVRSVQSAGTGNRSAATTLVRLRFSRQEADAIAALAPGPRMFKAVDFAASRAAATSPALADYAIVHFATHGLIDNQRPELSGIVLSLVDERGRPQDGFLRVYDIYNLKLGADLVVLSACQTALGKDIKGEGLIGLTRGFMYAGVPRLVASLWQIDDRATSELMKRFYASMLTGGERPASALRDAQLALSRIKGWDSPYYWAAFTLQGEWR